MRFEDLRFEDFWYVVAQSEQLKTGRVLSRQLLGEWLALFRNAEGKAIALQDR
ncbi:MAG: Rieske 2Fe-2S domain-containing protein, partial [Microcystaceae cyanobacterium]